MELNKNISSHNPGVHDYYFYETQKHLFPINRCFKLKVQPNVLLKL